MASENTIPVDETEEERRGREMSDEWNSLRNEARKNYKYVVYHQGLLQISPIKKPYPDAKTVKQKELLEAVAKKDKKVNLTAIIEDREEVEKVIFTSLNLDDDS